MLHLSMFAGPVAASNDLSAVPAPTDGWANVQNNRLILPEPTNMIACAAVGTSIGRAQIDCENFREVAPIDIYPLPTDLTGFANLSIPFYPPMSKKLPRYSGISGRANDPLATGANRFIYLWFGDVPAPVINPDAWTIFTQFSAENSNLRWNVGELSLVGSIPFGTYQLVGAVGVNAVLNAVRFRFKNQTKMMGVPISPNDDSPQSNVFHRGQLGVWGTFRSTESLIIEYIGPNFSPSTLALYLDLIKVG